MFWTEEALAAEIAYRAERAAGGPRGLRPRTVRRRSRWLLAPHRRGARAVPGRVAGPAMEGTSTR